MLLLWFSPQPLLYGNASRSFIFLPIGGFFSLRSYAHTRPICYWFYGRFPSCVGSSRRLTMTLSSSFHLLPDYDAANFPRSCPFFTRVTPSFFSFCQSILPKIPPSPPSSSVKKVIQIRRLLRIFGRRFYHHHVFFSPFLHSPSPLIRHGRLQLVPLVTANRLEN